MTNAFKTKLKNNDCKALHSVIDYLITNIKEPSIDEKLMIAVLNEVGTSLKRKMIEYKKEYKLTLTAAQALAIRSMAIQYFQNNTQNISALEARMLLICNQIDKQFQL